MELPGGSGSGTAYSIRLSARLFPVKTEARKLLVVVRAACVATRACGPERDPPTPPPFNATADPRLAAGGRASRSLTAAPPPVLWIDSISVALVQVFAGEGKVVLIEDLAGNASDYEV